MPASVYQFTLDFPAGSRDGSLHACDARDLASVPVWERSPGRRSGYSLQYSKDRESWWLPSMDCKEPDVTVSDTTNTFTASTFQLLYEHLGCFHFRDIRNKDVLNISMEVLGGHEF